MEIDAYMIKSFQFLDQLFPLFRRFNAVHVVINNGVHESVGGQPTLINKVDLKDLAIACGYQDAYSVKTAIEFTQICDSDALGYGPVLIEYKVKPGARKNLGRPTQSPKDNLEMLMNSLK